MPWDILTMFRRAPREAEWVSWAYVGLCTLAIYATIPLVRRLQKSVSAQWGRETFAYLVLACVGVLAALLITRVLGRGVRISPQGGVWLMAVAAVIIGWTLELKKGAPEEAVHFLEYGLLGILAFRAWSHRLSDWTIYLTASLLCALIGTVDEILQWLTPGRFWAFADVWLNASSGALVQVAIGKGFRPSFISKAPGRESWRWLSRLCAAELLLLGACASNTPPRVGWYGDRIPFLRFLKFKESMMAEYGHRIRDPEIGIFHSRFRPEVLRRLDAQRGREVAEILDRYRPESLYPAFLKAYSPVVDPFTHEARVHLFRRDRFLAEVSKIVDDPARRRYHYTVAFRENRILEEYFPVTLGQSSYVLPRRRIAFLKANLDPDHRYVSRVSDHLLVRLTERRIWAGILVSLAALVTARRALDRGARAVEGGSKTRGRRGNGT